MNILKLTLAYIQQNKLGTFLNIALLGLGMATIVVLMLFSRQLDENLQSNIDGIDLVVGAKGSPLQLILSSVFHIDTPPGNIPVKEARQLSMHPMVAETIPLALGDSYEQYRIVGSSHALLDHYGTSIESGSTWQNTFEAVVGAEVALEAGLSVGDELISAHGIGGGEAHGDHPLTVTGILEPAGTVIDRLVVTGVQTVWSMHGYHTEEEVHGDGHHEDEEDDHDGHEDDDHDGHGGEHKEGELDAAGQRQSGVDASDEELEYTSLLVKYKTPIAAATLPRYINKETSMQAAAPVFQTARLLSS